MPKKIMTLGKPRIEKRLKSNLIDEISRMTNLMHPRHHKWAYCCQLDEKGNIKMFDQWDHTILVCNYFLITKALIDETGSYVLETFYDYELLPEDLVQIEKDVNIALIDNIHFWRRESKFVFWLERNAARLNGMSPNVAMAYIRKEFYV